MTTIMIVDDKSENLYLLELMLKGDGYSTVSAKNGAEALSLARKNIPELIISDILMPVMDGFTLCRELKKDRKLRNIPFIFYTATYTDPKDEEFALSLGADRFLLKPLDIPQFISNVKEVLNETKKKNIRKEETVSTSEEVVLKEYNEALVRKLEDKMVQIEHAEKEIRKYNIALLREIEERKQYAEALRESEIKYRAFFENSMDSILLTSPDGRIFSANPAACLMFGYSEEELIKFGRSAVVDNTDPQLLLLLAERKRTGKAHGELSFIRKDGTHFPVEISSAVFTDHEGLENTSMIIRDITERKREEELLQESERSLKNAQRLTNVGDWKWNLATGVTFWSDELCRINGHDRQLPVPDFAQMSSFYTPESWKRLSDVIAKTLETGEAYELELDLVRTDGTLRNTLTLGEADYDNSGKIVGLHGTVQDITERKHIEIELIEAKEKAEEMNRLKTNFIHNMNHELRTPLNGILGFADLLISELTEPDQNEMAQGIFTSGKRLNETLNFILNLSEAETNKVELTSENIAVIPIAKNCINSFSKEAAKRNLLLETIIKDENIYAHLDERLFSRVLYNLLDNALKFTRQGKINVEIGKEVNAEKEWLYIKVKDSGIGIAEDKMDIIWDEFRQASEGLSRSHEGVGLGLTITKRVVELMKGKISVESEFGIGSTFTVKFPSIKVISPEEEVIKTKQVEAVPPLKEKANMETLPLVLYVEDDYSNRQVVKLFLKNICKVETAEDGEIALQLAAERKYDLILMDMNLGRGINGMEVVKELLKMPEYSGVPIVAVTAYAMAKDKAEFLNGGCTHYLSKPFDKKEFIDLITTVLG